MNYGPWYDWAVDLYTFESKSIRSSVHVVGILTETESWNGLAKRHCVRRSAHARFIGNHASAWKIGYRVIWREWGQATPNENATAWKTGYSVIWRRRGQASSLVQTAWSWRTKCTSKGSQRIKQPSVPAKMRTFHAYFATLTFPWCSTCPESFLNFSFVPHPPSVCVISETTIHPNSTLLPTCIWIQAHYHPSYRLVLLYNCSSKYPPSMCKCHNWQSLQYNVLPSLNRVWLRRKRCWYQLPHGLYAYSGHVINLPQDVTSFANSLPRPPNYWIGCRHWQERRSCWIPSRFLSQESCGTSCTHSNGYLLTSIIGITQLRLASNMPCIIEDVQLNC